jgi:hypothetical protein
MVDPTKVVFKELYLDSIKEPSTTVEPINNSGIPSNNLVRNAIFICSVVAWIGLGYSFLLKLPTDKKNPSITSL